MTDATVDKVEAAADQADKTAKEGAGALADQADQVRKAVTEKAGQAREWAGDRAGVARDWALDQSDVIRDTVQTKPFISVGVSAASAFAAGLVLGVLLTRR